MGWPQFISLSFTVQSDTEGRRKIIGQHVEAVLEVFCFTARIGFGMTP